MNRENARPAFNAAKSSPRMTLDQGRILLDREWSDKLGLTSEALNSLIAFDSAGAPVLSLFLTVDPTHRTKYQSRLHLKDLLKNSNSDPGRVSEDIARAADYLQNEYDWQAEGLAIFSCAPKKFWQVVRLPVAVQDSASVTDHTYLRPLLGVLSSQMRYGVALVDREVARFYGIYLGEIQELGEKRREVPKHHKQMEASPKLQRQAEEAAIQNLKQAAEDAVAIFDKFDAQQILLAGQAEPEMMFKEYLPKAWQARVVGELALDTSASTTQVMAKAKEIINRLEAERQMTLVSSLADDARKKGVTGALGLSDTLAALTEGKVMTLIVAQDFFAKGYQCENCGYLAAEEIEPCPICGHHMRLIGHAVDLAIRRALGNNAQVETVRTGDAARRLKELGGIGAMLRY
jgi:peptide subunit release factor 1 (eRF1)